MTEPTAATLRALAILRDNPGIWPKRFAQLMWPDSPAWKHHTKCGPKGSHQGGGMYMAAGGYLGRLRRAGLAEWWFPRLGWGSSETGWYLTPLGNKFLK